MVKLLFSYLYYIGEEMTKGMFGSDLKQHCGVFREYLSWQYGDRRGPRPEQCEQCTRVSCFSQKDEGCDADENASLRGVLN